MAKSLMVIYSENLPPMEKRDPNIIYFVYDKMAIYLGHNFYCDPFSIVASMPEDPVEGMLYILLNGDLKARIHDDIISIGSLYPENREDQLKWLSSVGTEYLRQTERRYMNHQFRTMILPFQNGSYQLNVAIPRDLMINENTLIRYNTETGRFEVYGDRKDEEEDLKDIDLTGYEGINSPTIETVVENNRIKSTVVVSPDEGNLIQDTTNGIYATISNVLGKDDIEALRSTVVKYQSEVNGYLSDIMTSVEEATLGVSEETINNMIDEKLKNNRTDINSILNNHKNDLQTVEEKKAAADSYTDQEIEVLKKQMERELKKLEDKIPKPEPPPELDYATFISNPGLYEGGLFGKSSSEYLEFSDSGANFELNTQVEEEEPAPIKKLRKMVYLRNTGESNCFVRIHLAFPKSLIDPDKKLQYEYDPSSIKTGGWNWSNSMDRLDGQEIGMGKDRNVYVTQIGEVYYIVSVVTYETPLKKSEITPAVLSSLYLDPSCTKEDILNFNKELLANWEIKAYFESCDSDGYDDPFTAFNAQIGAIGSYDPFQGTFEGTKITN